MFWRFAKVNSYFSSFLTKLEPENHLYPEQIMKVAIIIDTHSQANSLGLLLEDISKLKLYQTKIDIYIVNNHTNGFDIVKYAKFGFAHLQVIHPSKKLDTLGGFYYGLQLVSKLKYDYIWLLDDDVRLDPLALSTLITTLQNHHEVGLVSSQLYHRQEPKTIKELGNLINRRSLRSPTQISQLNKIFHNNITGKSYIRVEFCAAKSILLRQRVIHDIGTDTDNYAEFEDVDLCLRVKQAGWVLAVNSNSIIWQNSPQLPLSDWLDYEHECNFYYWQKYRPDLL
jgi:GT2 family glycosyltransferase